MDLPGFMREKVNQVHAMLADERSVLEIMGAEVAAREARVRALEDVAASVENEDWESVYGFQTRIPPLPPRPGLRRARRKPSAGVKRRRLRRRIPGSVGCVDRRSIAAVVS